MQRIVNHIVASHSLPVSNKILDFCQSCHMTKSHKLPFSSSTTVYNNPLELVVSDIWGPDPLVSNNGSRYYIIFMDVFSRYLWLFPLGKQSDALAVFISFKNKIERLLDCKIRTFQSNNGGEYIKFKKFLDYQHISHCFSCSHTPKQNGLAECLHRQIVETGLALFHTASIPPTYWDDAFQTACYLINRLPSSVSPTKSPLEILFHTSPEYNQLRVFGCECSPFLRPDINSPHAPFLVSSLVIARPIKATNVCTSHLIASTSPGMLSSMKLFFHLPKSLPGLKFLYPSF